MGSRSIGLLILLVGGVLLLGNIGVLPAYSIGKLFSTFWPVLLIYAGLTGLIESMRRRSRFGGSIWAIALIVFGAAYQLRNLGIVETSIWGMLWPLVLVGVGLSMLFGKSSWSSWNGSKVVTSISYDHNDDYEHRERYQSDRKIKSLVGDIKLGGPTYRLESSTIELKAGNIVLDLRDTVIPEGESVLDIHCKAGDIDVYLPEGLDVSVQAGVKMGQVQLNGQRATNAMLHYESEGFATSERRVKLLVSVKFGDVDVKQVR
ncbi:MAG: cell wall-active antibiotics response protein LiaF [Tumebacillaceae bacterium]